MKNTFVVSAILVLSIVVLAACSSQPEPVMVVQAAPAAPPQMPLTPELLQRMGNPSNHTITGFQFFLNGGIRLENANPNLGAQPVVMSGRTAIITGASGRQAISINNNTLGQALNIQRQGNRINVMVGFEENPNLFLTFSATTDDPQGYFELVYTPGTGTPTFAWDFRGMLNYGGEVFDLFYTGERPRLAIQAMVQGAGAVPSRVAPGRTP
ncbi:MAG: hypothetical protein FWG66_06510 [Spirochaetes bacterium]|nr:hypothetical protein [Spirochaetota bacterium]